jgi:cytochrome c oxidase subunit 1
MKNEGRHHRLRVGAALQKRVDWFRLHPVEGSMLAAGALISAVIVFMAGAIFVAWLGLYDVAATAGHTKAFAWFLHFTMRNSVKAHAPNPAAPSLDDPRLIAQGQSYAELRCAPCHGSPGRSADVSAIKMLPEPPNVTTLAREFTTDQLHWIIKHGVKMSAMPAWPTQQRDDEIWPLVAYLDRVGKSPDDFQGLAQQPEGDDRAGLGGGVTINTCFACHGADGNGRGGDFPKLAGLSENYIRASLEDYRSGTRQSGYMQPFAAHLSDAEIKTFAAHFGSLDRQSDTPSHADPGLLQHGARIADPAQNTRPVAACMACHTTDHPKRFSAIPDLAGQSAQYISAQLKLFRSGVRGATANSQIMGRIARGLSDADIGAVAAYFAAQPTHPADDDKNAAGGSGSP